MSNTLCDTHCQMATDFVHKHPSWAAVLVCPCTHGFIQAADPAGGELFNHIGIPCLYDLPNLSEATPEAGGCLAVIAWTFRIASRHFLNMNWPNLMGAPTKQSTSPMDQKSIRSGPLIVAMRNHKPRRNSP